MRATIARAARAVAVPCGSMSEDHPAIRAYAEHVNPAFVRLLGTLGYGRVFTKARGMVVRDHEGREYLDFLAGFGAINLGHNHPKLIEALERALRDDAPNVLHVGPQTVAGELGAMLASMVPELPMALFANSGGEAVESAMKLALGATRRTGFVYCEGGYHGTGLGNLSVMGHSRFRAPFEPLLRGCTAVPFGDLGALAKALRDRPAAFIVEPIQAEAGVIVPPEGYLLEAARLCRERGTLLILDEVQTGIGRTGKPFAFQHEPGFVPDVLVLGKSLGGSMVPISAALTTRALHQKVFGTMQTFDLHGSTFSGNAFACRAALATLSILEEERLSENAAQIGARMLRQLERALAGHPFVRAVRGRGLLLGIELGPTQSGLLGRLGKKAIEKVSEAVFGQWLAVRLLEEGVLAQPASQAWNVLRLEPPLVVSEEQADRAVDTIARILREYDELAPLLADVSKRLGRQALTGWGFG